MPKTNNNDYAPRPTPQAPKSRTETGNALTIVVLCTLAIVVIAVCIVQLCAIQITQQRQVSALESASLSAAKEISRVVIDDEYFGYVGLADQPPVIRGTAAKDGEPLPVRSINTILANARLQLLLADKIGHPELRELALQDITEARRVSRNLERVLTQMAVERRRGAGTDAEGQPLDPYGRAQQSYKESLGLLPFTGSDKLELKLGWLSGTHSTTTPRPEQLAGAPPLETPYPSGVDVPAGGESFFFAAASKQPSLVPPHNFRLPDGKRLCTVICAEAEFKRNDGTIIKSAACAEPWAGSDSSPPAIMLVSIPSGNIFGVESLHSLLSGSLSDSTVRTMTASMGDYPNDKHAQLVPNGASARHTVSQMVAAAFHDWLRATGTTATLDSLTEIVDTPFSQVALPGPMVQQNIAIEVDRNGKVVLTNRKRNPFVNQVVHENQQFSISDQTNPGLRVMISCRNQVHTLGSRHGGKHGGQPMPGNPVNWCELPYFGESRSHAQDMGRGSDALKLVVTGTRNGCAGGREAVSLNSVRFRSVDQKEADPQPRKSFYSGGLAAEIQITQL